MVKLKRQKISFRKKKIISPKKTTIHYKTIIKFLMALVLLGLVGVCLVRLKYMFVDSEYFMIKGVDIKLYAEDGSLLPFSPDEITGEKLVGTNIFSMDLNVLKQKIEGAHPEFKDVVIRRLLPNKLIVRADRRKGVAQIRSDRYYFVDEEGVVLPDVKNFPDPDLPIIAGIGTNLAKITTAKFSEFEKQKLTSALSFIKDVESNTDLAGYTLKIVDITDPGNISFYLELANVEIKIGNTDFRNRLSVLSTVLEQLGSDIDQIKYIDLRFEDPIVGPL